MTSPKRDDETPPDVAREDTNGQEPDDFGAEKFAQLIKSFLGRQNEAP